MDNILTFDPSVSTMLDSVANSGDGSAIYDDNTTPGTISNPAAPTVATPTPSGWATLFSNTLPSLVGSAAQGAIATQAKTATAANAAATAPATNNLTWIIAGLAVLAGLLFLRRR